MLPVHLSYIEEPMSYFAVLSMGYLLVKNLNWAVCIILPGLVFSACTVSDIIQHTCI